MGVAEFHSGKTVFIQRDRDGGFWLVGQSLLTLGLNEKTLRDHVQVLIWTRSYMDRIKGTKKGHWYPEIQQWEADQARREMTGIR